MILNMKHVCTRVHVPRGSPLSTDLGVSENRGPQYNSTLNSRILINKDPSQNRVPLIFGNSPFSPSEDLTAWWSKLRPGGVMAGVVPLRSSIRV